MEVVKKDMVGQERFGPILVRLKNLAQAAPRSPSPSVER